VRFYKTHFTFSRARGATMIPFPPHPSYRPCAQYKSATLQDAEDDLSFVKPNELIFLGKGDHGIVLRLNERMAVKITAADPFIKEMHTLRPHTQAFIATYGWLQHTGIPPSWMRRLPRVNQKGEALDWSVYEGKRLIFIFMEHSSFRMQMPGNPSSDAGVVFWHRLLPREAKQVLFIILHALYVARKRLGFSHNDLHDGQIMLFNRPDENTPIVLHGGRFVLYDCIVVPKIIDFGSSQAGPVGEDFSDDVGRLADTFRHLIPDLEAVFMQTEAYEAAAGGNRRDYKAIWNILNSRYFKEYRAPPKPAAEAAPILSCIGCMGQATHLSTRYHVCQQCVYYQTSNATISSQ
jgi:hypothetical protein